MSTHTPYIDPLRELLEHAPPRSVASIGGLAREALDAVSSAAGDARLHHLDWRHAASQIPELGVQDIVVVSLDASASADRSIAEPVLAALRDIYARKTVVLIAHDAAEASPWNNHDMVGLGFTRVGEFEGAGRTVSVYGFDIATYKTTPDWLSPRYWAHPELWGKYRW